MADTGEYSAVMPYLSRSDFSPYGEDYFPAPAGRWSNGRVFTDFISQELGYGLINPFLKSVNASFTYGASFATSASTARDLDYAYLFPLSVQVYQFEELLSEMLESHSLTQGYFQQQIEEAILLIETGSNDYGYQISNTTDFDVSDLVGDVLAAMETAFKRLYDLGGRNFIVMSLTPAGCAPSVLARYASFEEDEYGCKVFFNSISELHNMRLEELLTNLSTALPDAKWILFDAYSIFLDGYRNPANYGIEHPFEACCGAGGPYNFVVGVECGSSGVVNGTLMQATRCEDPSLYLIWDSIHPVESFAKHIADGILTGKYLTPAFNITSTCSNRALTEASL